MSDGSLDASVEMEQLHERLREALTRQPGDLKSLVALLAQLERVTARMRAAAERAKRGGDLAANIKAAMDSIGEQLWPSDR
jgi:hypothetical protein